ncbi:MAG TPA: CDP-alcohol phosphatidyltransferase family protein [Xanthobacteraceae bacterium]
MGEPGERRSPRAGRAAAFAVHVFTASGAGLALLAMLAAVQQRWAVVFAWLALAQIVDAVDGPIARRLNVKALAPRWSGDVLDLVVDILTYVFVPAYALVGGGILPEPLAVPLGLLIVVTGAIYFADTRMKSGDNFFMGFPATWNLIAFYLFLLRPDPWVAALAVVALCALTFARLPFVHPLRVRRGRALNVALLGAAGVLAAVALARDLAPGPLVTLPLALIGGYFLVAGFLLQTNKS